MDKEKILKEVDKKIDTLVEQGLTSTATIDALDKLVDMKKDLMEIEKMEMSQYSNYSEGRGYGARGNYREGGYSEGNYNEGGYGRRGNFREGGYGEGGNYGRRGRDSRGRYRGEEMLDEMNEQYRNYSEGREQYRQGNYGAENKKIESLEYMMECATEFVKYLKENADSQEEKKIIDKHIKKMMEM